MNDNRIKVLYIHHGTGIGGAPISLLNLIRGINTRKYAVKVAFIRPGVAEELFRENGIETEVIGASNVWFAHNQTGKVQWWYFYRYPRICFQWLRAAYMVAPSFLVQQDADIVHLNSHVLTSWAVAAKKLGKAVVLHNREAVSRGYFGIRYGILRRLIERSCDHVINISIDNHKRLGLFRNSHVVYNFVDIPETVRSPMSTSGSVNVLYLGGMAAIKGFKVAVDCLSYLNPNITVLFAGSMGRLSSSQSWRDKIKNAIKLVLYGSQYRLLKRVLSARNARVVGMVRNPLEMIDACDILITPFKIEHFSRPAIEAFAYGKPVIGSDVEGMDEIIDHGTNGLLVERGNPRALAEAINYLVDNPEVAKEMGRNARRKAMERFSASANVSKVEDIYDDLISRKL